MLESINIRNNEHIKINSNKKRENITRVEYNKNENKDSSFNQLLSLQLLIQKHSGIKELCKFFI